MYLVDNTSSMYIYCGSGLDNVKIGDAVLVNGSIDYFISQQEAGAGAEIGYLGAQQIKADNVEVINNKYTVKAEIQIRTLAMDLWASLNHKLVYKADYSSAYIDKRMKVGASIVSARRAGTTASFDVLNKYFTYSGMPIASGQYWNGVHGNGYEEAESDIEGMQQMRTLARNMTFLMKSIKLGKEEYGLPERERITLTNFIR